MSKTRAFCDVTGVQIGICVPHKTKTRKKTKRREIEEKVG
jgi:hypothetical protein